MNLFGDLARMAAARLVELNYPPGGTEDDETLVIRWLDIENRLPPQRKWQIKESRQLQARKQSLPAHLLRGLTAFNKKTEAGDTLSPHLSRKIRDANYLDDLLLDWNVTHFHLGERLLPNGLIEGTDEILFAVLDVDSGIMYQLDIHPHHGGFSRQELVQIMEDNWPELIEGHELKGVDVTSGYTDEEVREWRKLGVNVVVPTKGGRAFGPMGGGRTTARTSAPSQLYVNRARRILAEAERRIIAQRGVLEQRFRAGHGLDWDGLEFRLVEFGDRVKVKEVKTGVVVLDEELR